MIKRLLFFLFSIATQVAAAQSLPGSGNDLTFNGYSQYVNCGTADRGIINTLTVEAWVKTSSLQGQFAVTKYSNSLFSESGFEFGTVQGKAAIYGRAGKGDYFTSGLSTTLVSDGRWHHIAGQVEQNVWRIYVDGVLENSNTYAYSGGDLRTPEPLTIGTYTYLTNFYFQGDIDEVRVWRTARTAADIQQDMCRKFAAAPADLVAYYRFDQGSGLAATDQGSQPTNGTLVGFVGAPWHPSGAALGDASTALYQTSWPASARLALASAASDSAVVSGVSALAKGVQLYTVGSAPSIAAGAGAQSAYFGVFTAGSGSAATYTLRLHPLGGNVCWAAQQRLSNDLTWNNLATTARTATSLVYGPLAYRGEYILLTTGAAIPAVAIAGDSAVCGGATGQLTATAAGATGYRWSTGATSATLSNLGPGSYTVTASFASGCTSVAQALIRTARTYAPTISGDSVLCVGTTGHLQASAAGPVAYLWSTGATAASIVVSQPGTYTVTATSPAGCPQQASYRVRGAPIPTVSITGEAGLCAGGTARLTATAAGATSYRWSTGATAATIAVAQPGTYSVVATSAAGCASQASFQVQLLAVAPVSIGGDTVLCAGAAGRLAATATGATAYAWSTGATTASIAVGQAGTYTVTASFASGCSATAQVRVRVLALPTVLIGGDSVLCPGATAQLATFVGNATSPLTYRWNTSATTASLPVTQAGTYSVTVTNAAGCAQQASYRVRTALAAPTFTLGADTTLCDGETLTLRGPAGAGLRYLWSDGSTNRLLTVATAGSYSLRVSSQCGTTQAARVVAPRNCLLVPNIITPNHDARNDLFVVQGMAGSDWSLDVYNRWGRPVLHTDSYRNDWGQDAAPGMYYVLLRRASTGYSYKGWVEVVR
ncbi:MAG: LamG-like jellyroll fold domain-containing protein [Janthinobacterium lividum]